MKRFILTVRRAAMPTELEVSAVMQEAGTIVGREAGKRSKQLVLMSRESCSSCTERKGPSISHM